MKFAMVCMLTLLASARCLAADPPQTLTLNDLVNRPERWPASVTSQRDFNFNAGGVVHQGDKLTVLKFDGRQVVLAASPTLRFAALPADVGFLDAANQVWAALTPAQRAVDPQALAADPSLWPIQVTVLTPMKCNFGSLPSGAEVGLASVAANGPVLIWPNSNNTIAVDFHMTDVIDRARQMVLVDPDKRPSRIAAALKGIMVDADGNTVSDAGLEDKKYFALYIGAQWCPPCHAFSPILVKFAADALPKHPELAVVFLSDDKDADQMFAYMKEMRMPFPAVRPRDFDNSRLLNSYRYGVIPDLVVVDRFGRVVTSNDDGKGTRGDPADTIVALAKLLGAPRQAGIAFVRRRPPFRREAKPSAQLDSPHPFDETPPLAKENHPMKFTFGLWTVGNVGRDPFGEPTRPKLSVEQLCRLLGEVGAYGVNFHDNDAIPIDATPTQAAQIIKDFKKAVKDNGLAVPMATTNLFSDPVFKDGAFTSNNARVRAYAIQKTMRSMAYGAEMGAKIYVFWGGREGVETDAAKDPVEAIKRFREAINFLCEHSLKQGYGYKFAFEAKPNEPRGHIYFSVTGNYLGFIPTLDHPEMCGVNPEVAHEHMAGLNFVHQVAAALDAGKLFHIDLNDQEFGRYDQDFRFGSANLKHAFFLVKLLEDYQYNGPRHFDAHAYRQSDYEDVKEFAKGCIRTYEILKKKAAQWNADKEIQALLKGINQDDPESAKLTRKYSAAGAAKLAALPLDRVALAEHRLPYEKLDQLTMELIMGVR